MPISLRSLRWFIWIVAAGFFPAATVFGQTPTCPAVAAHSATAADTAYANGSYAHAEDLYGQAVAQKPQDMGLAAALVRTWLHEGEITQASAKVDKMQAEDPHSAITLTALAEVQLRQGQHWLALETLNEAAASDPCYARIHFVRSRALRIDSMYATERAEIQKAYDIDPSDPDIKHAWLSIVHPANEIEGIDKGLATFKDMDADSLQRAKTSMESMLSLLSENSQTCKVLPNVPIATLPLAASYLDAKHIEGYKLDVQFAQSKARLQVDTAASGLFISRALADLNGFQRKGDDPQGTVHVDSLQIGPLEFRDCIVGVSESPFSSKADGFIGTDMFASYLITLDPAHSKLMLEPLPQLAGVLPGDRPTGNAVPAELRGFMPVYHRRQYLLVPAMLDNKARRLFILDSGIRASTMRPDVAHSVSTTKINFTNSVQTVSGSTLQVYRDSFDFQLANLSLNHQSHIFELDPTAIDQNAGFQIAGMLGFDMLHSLVMHLDYRDGLVKLEPIDAQASPGRAKDALMASAGSEASMAECQPIDAGDSPLTSTIEAKVTLSLDAGHLKPGKEISAQVVNEWLDPQCKLPKGSTLYGHVTASASSKSPGASELALVFDHGECEGKGKKELTLKIIGLVGPPDGFEGLQNVMPTEVAGGSRSISTAAANIDSFALTINLNPGGPPHTVHPGIVAGMPKLKLQPEGGPACSARISSADRDIRLDTGAEFILIMYDRQ